MSLQSDTPQNEPDKLTPKQEALLIALMQHPTMQGAATACKLSETTVWRMMKEPAFAAAYANARREAMGTALSFLQKATGSATAALVTIYQDKEAPPSARVSAARSVLEYAFKGVEMLELEQRIAALEASLNTESGSA